MDNIKLNLVVPEEYEIKNDILNNLEYDVSKIEGTYSYESAAAHSIELKKLYDELATLFPELFPWSCTKEPYLSMHMTTFGLTRREAVKAEGQIKVTGNIGARIEENTILISRVGIKYQTIESKIIEETGSININIECLETGTIGNCGIGDITTFEIANTNINSVINENPITSGADIESVEVAKERMHLKASTPAHSGNKNDYLLWAKSRSGVGKVTVWAALEKPTVTAGQVEIMISTYDYKIASPELIQDVQNYINSVRILNADARVKSFIAKNISIVGSVKVSDSTNIDTVKNNFKSILEAKLTDESFLTENVLSIGKVGNILFDIPGVIDYKDLKLNNQSGSIELTDEEITMISEVNLTQWT